MNFSEEFKNFNRNDKFTIHAVFGQKSNEVRLEQKQPTLDDLRAKLEILNNNKIAEEKLNNEEGFSRKHELIAGAKNILKGIYTNNFTSVYQDNYKLIF